MKTPSSSRRTPRRWPRRSSGRPSNEEAVRAAIATNLEIPEEAAAGITLPTFTWDLADAGIEDLGALAVEFAYIEAEPDYDTMIQQQ